MTSEQTIEVLELYDRSLSGFPALRASPKDRQPMPSESLAHARWMCQEAIALVRAGKADKANRWLGFIQGVLWSAGTFTIDQMKEHNRSKEGDGG